MGLLSSQLLDWGIWEHLLCGVKFSRHFSHQRFYSILSRTLKITVKITYIFYKYSRGSRAFGMLRRAEMRPAMPTVQCR